MRPAAVCAAWALAGALLLVSVAPRPAGATPQRLLPVQGEPTSTAADDSAAPEAEPDVSKGPRWLLLATPTAGWLDNEIRFHFKVPGPKALDGTYSYQEHTAALRDEGLGGGLTLVAFYRWISLTNVFFWFPDVNQSSILGTVTDLSASIPTGTFVEPYLGLGIVWVKTDTDYEDFRYSIKQDLYGKPAVGYAAFDRISVDNRVIAPVPKVGVKFKLPIQHWYVSPFYSFMYEDVQTHAQSPGGDVEVYYKGDRALGLDPQLAIEVPEFDTRLSTVYTSHLGGANIFLDFHYFLQLRTKVYYNFNHDLWTVRSIGSILFNRYFGLTAYFEYSQKTTVTNTYFLIGPAFLVSPTEFFDALDRRRKGR